MTEAKVLKSSFVKKKDIQNIDETNNLGIQNINIKIEEILFLMLNLKSFLIINDLFSNEGISKTASIHRYSDKYSYELTMNNYNRLSKYIVPLRDNSNYYTLNDTGILAASLISFNYTLQKALDSKTLESAKKWAKVSKDTIGEIIPQNSDEYYSHRSRMFRNNSNPIPYDPIKIEKILKNKKLDDIMTLLFLCPERRIVVYNTVNIDKPLSYYTSISDYSKLIDSEKNLFKLTYRDLNDLIKINLFKLNLNHEALSIIQIGYVGTLFLDHVCNDFKNSSFEKQKEDLDNYLKKVNV